MGRAAKASKELAKGKTMGRPTEFNDSKISEAYRLSALGLVPKEMAAFWGVSEAAVYAWKNKDPEFAKAIEEGKTGPDARVAMSLYKRAIGYTHEAVKIFCNAEGKVTEVPYTEHFAPDTTACIFWLKNRRPDLWRDRVEASVKTENSTVVEFTLKIGDMAALPGDTAKVIEQAKEGD